MIRFHRTWTAAAALLGFVSVAAGAFGAHGAADPKAAEWLRTGGVYGLCHALAVFAAAHVHGRGGRTAAWAAPLFLIGALLFCGSLFAMALGAPRVFGAITPLGGTAFLAGWALLAVACLQSDRA